MDGSVEARRGRGDGTRGFPKFDSPSYFVGDGAVDGVGFGVVDGAPFGVGDGVPFGVGDGVPFGVLYAAYGASPVHPVFPDL